MLAEWRQTVVSIDNRGYVMFLVLAVSYFSLCRGSMLWAYARGQVHLEFFCRTRKRINIFYKDMLVALARKATATAVQVIVLGPTFD